MTKKVQIHLKNIVTISLKFEKVADNAARFECNVILKMLKKGDDAQITIIICQKSQKMTR